MPRDEEVFQRDGFRCVYCDHDGRTFEGWAFLVVDHFKPKSRGGDDDPENLKTACVICNHMKGAFEWPSLEETRSAIGNWRQQMHDYWERQVEPLLPPSS
jgi:hypothetical protein